VVGDLEAVGGIASDAGNKPKARGIF